MSAKLINQFNVGEHYIYNWNCLPSKYSQKEYNTFFDFHLGHKDIEDRIYYTNCLILSLFEQWRRLQDSLYIQTIEGQNAIGIQFYTGKDIVLNIKRIADECMTLYCIATKKYHKDNSFLEDIGQYICESDRFKDFNDNLNFLKELNRLANACKHSLISINDKLGKEEPCIFAYETKKDKSAPVYRITQLGYTINYLVDQFNCFYKHFREILNQTP